MARAGVIIFFAEASIILIDVSFIVTDSIVVKDIILLSVIFLEKERSVMNWLFFSIETKENLHCSLIFREE